MRFNKIPQDTFKHIQLNAGILTDSFTASSGEIGNLLGATTGGVNFSASPSFKDFGSDIDNCPTDMKELKKLDQWTVKINGTFVTVTPATAKRLIGAADIDESDGTHITPRKDINNDDFEDLWWVGDYSDENGEAGGGFVAIHVYNTLSTGGFSIQSTNKEKGQFNFEFTGHYSMEAQDKPPFEIYIQEGTGAAA